MQDQNKKMFRWVLGSGLVCLVMLAIALLIVKLVFGGTQQHEAYVSLVCITLILVYLVIASIVIAKNNKYLEIYEQEKIEKTKKELVTEYKSVFLKYTDIISPEAFKCQAKVDEDGKILCEIKLDRKVKFESYEEFLGYFHLQEE